MESETFPSARTELDSTNHTETCW